MKRFLLLILLLFILASPVMAKSLCASCTGGTGGGNVTATIAVNYTFTGAPGTAALVTNIGNAYAANLNFVIPQGANGANGADGAPGAPGAPGAANMTAGPIGPAGPPGTTDMSWNTSYLLKSTGDSWIATNKTQVLATTDSWIAVNKSTVMTIANDTQWDKGYTMPFQWLSTTHSIIATMNYFGSIPRAAATVAGTSRMYVPKSGNITKITAYEFVTTIGGYRSCDLYLQVNGGTGKSALISRNATTVPTGLGQQWVTNASWPLTAVVAGDYIEISANTSVQSAAAPVGVLSGFVYIE